MIVSAEQCLLTQGLGGPLTGQVGAWDAAGLDLGGQGVMFAAAVVAVGQGDELGHQGGGGPVVGAVDAADLGLAQALDQLVAVGAADHGHGGQGTGPVALDLAVVAVAQGFHGRGHGVVQFAGRDDDGEAVLVAVTGLLPASAAAQAVEQLPAVDAPQALEQRVGAFEIGGLDAHAEAVAGEQAHGDETQGAGSDDGVVVGAFGAGDVALGLEQHENSFRVL